jgi:hypothetical protein
MKDKSKLKDILEELFWGVIVPASPLIALVILSE